MMQKTFEQVQAARLARCSGPRFVETPPPTEPMMRVTCTDCGAEEILPVGRREEVVNAIVRGSGRCIKCRSSRLAYRELMDASPVAGPDGRSGHGGAS